MHDGWRVLVAAAALVAGAPGAALGQTAKWDADIRFPGTFFPAFALSAAGLDAKGPVDTPQASGYLASASFAVRLVEAPAGSKVKIRVDVPEIGVSGEIETSAPQPGQPKFVAPRLSWSQARLAGIAQPITAEVIFTVSVDGVAAGEQRKPLRIRASNDSPIRACRTPTQCADYSQYMAAFVNEDHPVIDRVLREALEIPVLPVKRWVGTQATEQEVMQQVWAIWYLFQRKGMTYSNITTVSDTRAEVFSQTVRPLSQALETQQANCIDGTALFASILRKIGIEPMIVLVPGHAFLGFFADAQQTRPVFLETTMLNSPSNPFYRNKPTKAGMDLARITGNDIHMKQSWASFTEAIAEGQREYAAAQAHFGKTPGYALVPIRKARSAGIQALPL